MTPLPLPSHPGIGARHTGHLHEYQTKPPGQRLGRGTLNGVLPYLASREEIAIALVAPTAVNRHSPHII